MSEVPHELSDAWKRLEKLGWRADLLEWVRSAEKGERNRVFIARHDGTTAVIRLSGKKPGQSKRKKEHYAREMYNLAAAAEAGVTPTPLLADPSDGLLVLPFVQGRHPVRRQVERESAVRIARCLSRLHRGAPTFLRGTDFLRRIHRRVRKVCQDEAAARLHAPRLPETAKALEPVLDALHRTAPPLAACHGDLVLENIIDDGERAHLIDWETSTSGDPHQDVGTVLLRARMSRDVREAFLAAYFADHSTEEEMRGRARVRLWQTARALDKALIYWRNGVRSGKIDKRVKGWTRRCFNLLFAPDIEEAIFELGMHRAKVNHEK
ncbi:MULTISPECIES: phosphotransferase [unclassified Wenzhouxiangella]|uniref:phosphotransferase n=1 Tax=unclassified Wenzhouxiangella TaxID=2613841 RepID=UPI000E328EE3|nr:MULTISPECIES: phosphotransferase [unclassified Wenzhouxiangella]RFF26500.1 hypothetical protein DZK25_12645 [Wenzhouxiangella sp. 15181]RFP69703.1 hypothetical protein DZK26_02885 [Wenzhouxiangella sp. 15190]